MGNTNRNFSVFSIIIFSCFFVQFAHAKSKGEAFDHYFHAKYRGNSGIETSLLQVNPNEHHVNTPKMMIPGDYVGSKENDRIDRLPGQPDVDFEQYGGYITTDESAGRALYYYFAEAQHYPKESLPLLLWLNGGPGCSSLGYGAMQELGPFRVRSDGKTLFKNHYSWNYAANVLFLESPAGVGFSYSNTTSDYDKSGDQNTADDNYRFLVNWLERFPEYKDRDFYISGESYAGRYVPDLAHAILDNNKKAGNPIINLKGILIGNAVINDETDNLGMYDYFATHAIISQEDIANIKQHCDFSPNATTQTLECNSVLDKTDKQTSYLDIYNIYAPLCTNPNTTPKPKKASLVNFDPCSDYYVYAYLNRADVQEAMHANVTKLDHDWEPCSDIIRHWAYGSSTVLPLLQEFMDNGLRVWIFSGDVDGRVPVTSTQYSIEAMNLDIKTEWHPWYLQGEVGGFTQVYKGDLTFATVRGAGHQVPSYKPFRALSLIKHFLDGTPLPDTTRYPS
ncbi:serine carboxypeptidase-like 40 [Mercurialis annua]|uniref:serine carboxypeptidase-like 40 n=1 Tax=Mercurialis annua TaxID=3986 RepID=UPI0021603151|nr:serine carboxypeptidase-like 40 [Mercurialis annua]